MHRKYTERKYSSTFWEIVSCTELYLVVRKRIFTPLYLQLLMLVCYYPITFQKEASGPYRTFCCDVSNCFGQIENSKAQSFVPARFWCEILSPKKRLSKLISRLGKAYIIKQAKLRIVGSGTSLICDRWTQTKPTDQQHCRFKDPVNKLN